MAGARRVRPLFALSELRPSAPAPQESVTVDYVQKEVSNKLVFPPDKTEHPFNSKDLELECFIGQGRFGKVAKMLFPLEGVPIALAVKRVRMTSTRGDEHTENRTLKQVQNEINAIRKASDCPEIVSFYGVTFAEGDCWVCMELMDASLEQINMAVHGEQLNWKFFDELVLASVAVSTIIALNHLKTQQNLIHRDVKPSNILVNEKGQVKLCDFGISGYLVDSVAKTQDVGCRPYMAPERMNNDGYDVRSDVWSLGITMMELCNGVNPYTGLVQSSIFSQMQLVVDGDAPVMENEQYSTRTRIFINSCLTKSADARPDLKQLMSTEYFNHHRTLPSLLEHVGNYIRTVLPHVTRTTQVQ